MSEIIFCIVCRTNRKNFFTKASKSFWYRILFLAEFSTKNYKYKCFIHVSLAKKVGYDINYFCFKMVLSICNVSFEKKKCKANWISCNFLQYLEYEFDFKSSPVSLLLKKRIRHFTHVSSIILQSLTKKESLFYRL